MKPIQTKQLKHIDTDQAALKEAAEIIQAGGLAVMPTETVYGLGANALDQAAIARIFEAKGRPSDNPLIVHLHSLEQAAIIASEIPSAAEKLFKAFSPGPLTIVLPKNDKLPGNVTAGLDTVGIRIPSHPSAQALLKACGLPIAAPSANRSGRPSPTTFRMAVEEMNGRVEAVIDGGDCAVGLESTVVRITGGEVRILRPGAVTDQMILAALGENVVVTHATPSDSKPQAPGMKYTHYKPEAEVIVCADIAAAALAPRFAGRRIGVLALAGHAPQTHASMQIKEYKSLEEYARELFKAMVDFDRGGCELILAEAVDESGIGRAIMNRLMKASGGKSL